ncbi:MAG: ABC transporter substrate-binding protein [Thalassospira sp.]|uniref:ABC transporter substrate-binding protein n=1 Tax=Thalassospira sp. TaxID=1912094 RepID=UPI003A856F3B
MFERDWLSFRFSKQHLLKCAFPLIFFTGFIIALNSGQKSAHAQDGNYSNSAPAEPTPFEGEYIIHLSESDRPSASDRPEPGYFDSLAIALFDQAGLKSRIVDQMPWKRQMELSEHESGHVLYPTTRVDYRENAFKWVGPVSRTIWKLYGFEERGWPELGLETLLRDARIGVLMGSARETYLRQLGAANLVVVPREELLLPMMLAERVDLIAIGGNILRHYIDEARADDSSKPVPDIDGALPYRTCYLYIAISGDVPNGDIDRLQTTLDGFKTNGFFIENRKAHGLSSDTGSSFLRAMLDLGNNGVSCVDLNEGGL